MLLSIFTPSHDTRWLDDAYRSLLDQGDVDWEWVVILNGDATYTPLPWQPPADPRVRAYGTDTTGSVGALKAEAVKRCRGDVLVELDHDDFLLPGALAAVQAAVLAHPEVGLVYTDTIQVDDQLANACPDYPVAAGWTYATAYALGAPQRYAISPPPTPHNVSLIWYAPNHLRAFTREAYDAVGGYDPSHVVLDDQELMARLYAHGPFIKAGGPLYVQRVHSANTQADPDTNAAIQTGTLALYDQHIETAALARAQRAGLLALDLGAAHAAHPAYTPVDQHPVNGIQHTLPAPMDLPDSTVGVIRAHDFLEHVADKVALWNELHRLLAPGGLLLTHTPSTDGRGAWQDPTHVAGYNANSFWYFTDPAYAAYVPELTARFQLLRVRDHHPTPWHAQHRIPYVTAVLAAVKPGVERSYGPLLW